MLGEPTWGQICLLSVVAIPAFIFIVWGIVCYVTAPKSYREARVHSNRYKNNATGCGWWCNK